MPDKQYSRDEIEALERRNQMANEMILLEIKELKEIALRNDRALRGHNGSPGLLSSARQIAECTEKIQTHEVLLKGKEGDREDIGIVGEQKKIREWVEEVKKAVNSVRWWLFFATAGFLLEIFFAYIRPAMLSKP